MALSGRDLRWYVETGKLRIVPVQDDQFQQNGIDLILEQVSERNTLFALGSTREVLELPDDLMAHVGIRSTWARQGFMVPYTIVDAGFRGNLTLEIARLDPRMEYPIGQRFAHLVFDKLTSPAEAYRGKYDRQSGITEAK